jgi:hypothetical protein
MSQAAASRRRGFQEEAMWAEHLQVFAALKSALKLCEL